MTISSSSNGTQTATISTEHTLDTITAAGVYVLVVDMSNLANGDTVELRAKTKVLSGGSAAQDFCASFLERAGRSGEEKHTRAICGFRCVFTLKQTAGTGRALGWNIYTL